MKVKICEMSGQLLGAFEGEVVWIAVERSGRICFVNRDLIRIRLNRAGSPRQLLIEVGGAKKKGPISGTRQFEVGDLLLFQPGELAFHVNAEG